MLSVSLTACKAGAIDHTMQGEDLSLQVGALVVSPGFETFDARLKGEYGYGRYPNVITSLEFERILSASGPFQGHIQRPSDGREPTKVAWIQCVGSRDASHQSGLLLLCLLYVRHQTGHYRQGACGGPSSRPFFLLISGPRARASTGITNGPKKTTGSAMCGV